MAREVDVDEEGRAGCRKETREWGVPIHSDREAAATPRGTGKSAAIDTQMAHISGSSVRGR